MKTRSHSLVTCLFTALVLTPAGLALVPPPPAQESGGAEEDSPWTPETLDVGVDLSEVEVVVDAKDEELKAKEAEAKSRAETAPDVQPRGAQADGAADDHAGHDHGPGEHGHGQAAAGSTPRPPVKVYGDGEPDAETVAANPDRGFLSAGKGKGNHDFGNLNQGDKVEHTFELAVTGSGPVTVREIKRSCGCTAADASVLGEGDGAEPYQMGTPLQPGSTLIVKAVLDTKQKRDRMRSVVTVLSDDPRGSLQLQLMANVVPFFQLDPTSLNFGQMKPDQVATQVIEITSPAAEAFKLHVKDELFPEELGVRLEPVEPKPDGSASKWKAHVSLGPNLPEGPRRNYQVQFFSDQEMANADPLPDGTRPVHTTMSYAVVSVLGQVSVKPHYMSFGLMREGQSISRTVRVENNDDEFEMEPPTASLQGYSGGFEYPDSAKIEVIEVEPGKAYDVKMTMTGPEGLTGTFRGKLVVRVGHPTKPTLELPFTGVVRQVAPSPKGGQGR